MKQDTDQQVETTAGVGAQRIAQVYAEAFLNAAEKTGRAEDVLDELDSLIKDLFPADAHLEAFLASGAIGRDRKATALRHLFEGRAGDLFTDFLLVLNHHERLDLLRPIRIAARRLYDERARRLRVQVRSAVPLADDQRQQLVRQLQATFAREPILEARVDPDLLGGLVVRVGDWVYDWSVRTQIDTIRNQLIERSSHEIQSGRDRFSSADGN